MVSVHLHLSLLLSSSFLCPSVVSSGLGCSVLVSTAFWLSTVVSAGIYWPSVVATCFQWSLLLATGLYWSPDFCSGLSPIVSIGLFLYLVVSILFLVLCSGVCFFSIGLCWSPVIPGDLQ